MNDFFIAGGSDDPEYTNVRDQPHLETTRQFIACLWRDYEPFADPNCRTNAKNHFLARFWEMYLTVTLKKRGFKLKRIGNEGPEFYIEQGNKRLWVEAIAPGPGDGLDRVPEVEYDSANLVPTEKILLRFTHALKEKGKKYRGAIEKGIISPNDGYLLAINSRAIPHAPYGNTLPFFVQAYLPFGDYSVTFDQSTGDICDSLYQYRGAVCKKIGTSVSTRAFLDPEYAFVSAVLHSSVDCVNRPDELGGDFCVLHNPNATHSIEQSLFNWSTQMAVVGNELVTSEPN